MEAHEQVPSSWHLLAPEVASFSHWYCRCEACDRKQNMLGSSACALLQVTDLDLLCKFKKKKGLLLPISEMFGVSRRNFHWNQSILQRHHCHLGAVNFFLSLRYNLQRLLRLRIQQKPLCNVCPLRNALQELRNNGGLPWFALKWNTWAMYVFNWRDWRDLKNKEV